jgi:type IV secretory pathway protease TraF
LAFVHPAPRLIWNATASTPTGLYALRPAGQLRALELVAVRAPEPIASYLADGGFLPNPTSRIDGFLGGPPVLDQRFSVKGLHYIS